MFYRLRVNPRTARLAKPDSKFAAVVPKFVSSHAEEKYVLRTGNMGLELGLNDNFM